MLLQWTQENVYFIMIFPFETNPHKNWMRPPKTPKSIHMGNPYDWWIIIINRMDHITDTVAIDYSCHSDCSTIMDYEECVPWLLWQLQCWRNGSTSHSYNNRNTALVNVLIDIIPASHVISSYIRSPWKQNISSSYCDSSTHQYYIYIFFLSRTGLLKSIVSPARRLSRTGNWWIRDRDHHSLSPRQVTHLPPVWDLLLPLT